MDSESTDLKTRGPQITGNRFDRQIDKNNRVPGAYSLIPDEQFTRQLSNQAFHFEAE